MTPVREIMTADPIVAVVPSARRDLVKLFREHAFHGFPVVKQGGRNLMGLVTRQDLLGQPDEDQVALLMNPNPATTYPEAHVREAARLLQHDRVRTLPIVASGNELVGIVTPADLLRVLRRHRSPVSAFLGRRVVPIHQGTPAPVALEIFRITRAGAMPILDDDGMLTGILTDGDLLGRAEVRDTIVKTISGMGADSDEWTWEGLRDIHALQHASTRIDLPRRPVRDFMVQPVTTVMPTTSVGEAAEKMLEAHVSQLPVVDGENHVLDMIHDLDLLGALLG